jgi:hypothetical protein
MTAKKPKKGPEESDQSKIISLEVANDAGPLVTAVSKAVFDDKFEAVQRKIKELKTQGVKLERQAEKLDGKSNALILGVLVVTILFCLGIFLQANYFMASYNERYLDTQDKFAQEIKSLRSENLQLKSDLEDEMRKIAEKQTTNTAEQR